MSETGDAACTCRKARPRRTDLPPGVAVATAIVSVMAGIPVRRDLAMIGEITLRGRVWPIAGLKEKLLAALRGGIKTVLIPEENAKDLVENRGQHQEWARDRSGVCTENSILIDYMTESPNVSGDDRSAILLPDAVRLAERRSLVLHPDGKEQGIFSSE